MLLLTSFVISHLALPLGTANKITPTHTGIERQVSKSIRLGQSLQCSTQGCGNLDAQAKNAQRS